MSEDIFNKLTLLMDTYVKKKSVFNTYIYKNVFANKYILRYPGASVGYVEVDESGTIIDIKLYEDVCFEVLNIYDKDVLRGVNKFIGERFEEL